MTRRHPTSEVGPATLGMSLAAGVRLVAWCNKCLYTIDADVAALVVRYGAHIPVPECGSRDCAFVVAPRSTGGQF